MNSLNIELNVQEVKWLHSFLQNEYKHPDTKKYSRVTDPEFQAINLKITNLLHSIESKE